jgi:RecB family exonuclease
MRWSPTRLAALGRCGFKFFAGYLLGLAEERDPTLEVLAIEQGTLFHRVLQEFFLTHPALPQDLEGARAVAREFLAAARGTAARSIPAKDPAFFALTWTRLEAALDELVLLEHRAQAERGERGLGVERRLERPVTFELADPAGGPPLTIHGTPDRVEVERQGGEARVVRVLDYKVSRHRTGFPSLLDPEKELGRTGFQIPVYLLGALAAGIEGVTEETALEGGYLVLLARDGEKEVVRRVPHEVLGLVTERIRALVAAAAAGRFDVDPHPCDPHCSFRAVCRYQPPPLEEEEGDSA